MQQRMHTPSQLYIFPQPIHKENYYNLKYSKFKPIPEFATYYLSYVGLAALEAVPQLKQIFNNDEQLIWRYMQKKSIEFNTYNKEKDFGLKLIFFVLAEQITKNIITDFNVRNIKFQSFVEKELLILLENNYDNVKNITKTKYKKMYDKIVLKLFGYN